MPLNRTDAIAAAAAALFLGLLAGESALLAEGGPGTASDPLDHCAACDAWNGPAPARSARGSCEDGLPLPGIYAGSLNRVSADDYRFSDNHDPWIAFERVIAPPRSSARPLASRENRRCNG
jgi:hypothetical protein